MRIILLTQDDPFYLAQNIDYLIKNLPSHSEVVATVVMFISLPIAWLAQRLSDGAGLVN